MGNKKQPLVSVILVNFNGKKFLKKCLDSIFENEYENYEVIVVDNKSNDESIERIRRIYKNKKNLKIILNTKNSGPAGGLNLGAVNASGKYLAILGYDTVVDKKWLSSYVELMERDDGFGILQGKLLKIGDKRRFAYAGDYLGPFGFLIERARSAIDKGQFDKVEEIFAINSATMIIRKDLFDNLGGFDDNFFMYLEEADLCWRTHLVGKKVAFCPKSKVWHHDSTKVKSKENFQENMRNYYGARNYIWMLIKNWSWRNLLLRFPIHVVSWVVITFTLVIKKDFGRALAILKALFWHALHIRKVLISRNKIQKEIRRVKDENFKYLMENKSIGYFFGKALAYVNKKPF